MSALSAPDAAAITEAASDSTATATATATVTAAAAETDGGGDSDNDGAEDTAAESWYSRLLGRLRL